MAIVTNDQQLRHPDRSPGHSGGASGRDRFQHSRNVRFAGLPRGTPAFQGGKIQPCRCLAPNRWGCIWKLPDKPTSTATHWPTCRCSEGERSGAVDPDDTLRPMLSNAAAGDQPALIAAGVPATGFFPCRPSTRLSFRGLQASEAKAANDSKTAPPGLQAHRTGCAPNLPSSLSSGTACTASNSRLPPEGVQCSPGARSPAYVVGGAVRTCSPVRRPDFDVATSATPEQVRGEFAAVAHHRPSLQDRSTS